MGLKPRPNQWDVAERAFREQGKLPRMRVAMIAMRRVLATLRADPIFEEVDVRPDRTALILGLEGLKSVVSLGPSNEHATHFDMCYVDGPVEYDETIEILEPKIIDKLIDYLERLYLRG